MPREINQDLYSYGGYYRQDGGQADESQRAS